MHLQAGTAFAGYEVVRLLGAGGMGQVYLVDNVQLGRREAMKIIAGGGTDFGNRFTQEARTAASLHHPSIVTVYHYGVNDALPWFTMSFVPGEDLLSSPRLNDVEIYSVADQVCAALDYAHSHSVIHRDIKPANIIVSRTDDGAFERATVLDFGIAKLLGATALTATNAFVGTLTYAAPEIIDGQPASPASDQYSLACTLYELFCGTPPFIAEAAPALIMAHLSKAPAPVSEHRPNLGALDPVFARAFAKNPRDRYATCRDFAAALATATDTHADPRYAETIVAAAVSPSQTTSTPTASQSGPARPRRRRLVLSALVAFVVVVAAAAAVLAFTRTSSPPQTVAAHFTNISTGGGTVCAPAGGPLFCWGANGKGQVGDGTTVNRLTPTRVPGLNNVTAVSTGEHTTCAIDSGALYCWGDNSQGQLGDGTTTDRTSPTRVIALNTEKLITVSTNAANTCTSTTHLKAFCWGGAKTTGQSGAVSTNRLRPAAVRGQHSFLRLSVGSETVCGVADAVAYCWDHGGVPMPVTGLTHVRDIVVGAQTLCAIADRSVYCWGSNHSGQVGDGTTVDRPSPTNLGLANVTSITSGNGTTCAIANKETYCWGLNIFGQLGDGTTGDRATPYRVDGVTDATSVSTNTSTTCATTAAAAYCWGINTRGSLGDNTTNDSTTPSRVSATTYTP